MCVSTARARRWFVVVVAAMAVAPAPQPTVVRGDADSTADRLTRARAGLTSPRPEERERGLADLEGLLAREPAACGAALSSLREILRLRSAAERARVARLLLKLPGEEAAETWWRVLDPAKEADDRVLAAAIEAVSDRATDPALARRLLDRGRDPKTEPWRRALVVEAMGGLESPAVPLVLHVARPGADWVEESCRALALGRRGRADGVGPLIELLGHAESPPRIHAWESLVRITRQAFPPTREPWATWWDAQRGRPPAPVPPPVAAPGDLYTSPPPIHVPSYYGVPVRGPGANCGVVFCLDVSASMSEHGIEPARRHLETTIRELSTRTSFDVVAFNENVMPLAGRLARAHPVAKARAIRWLDAIVPKSFTNIYDAVETAFQYAGHGRSPASDPQHLDLVFLLSDGAPNRGRYQMADQLVAGITALSRRRVPVHTIGAGEGVLPLLREISAATGGTFQRAAD